ncbi:MAG: very short patch repair endonuclease [Ktedonobacteraceae bacterium]
MTDIVDKETRSRMMSGIRGKDTKPEVAVRSYLHKKGFRFRLHRKDLPGKPDIILPKYKIVIFVHGCFWHRHKNCEYAYMPKSNLLFWNKKFSENVARDKRSIKALKHAGWDVLVLWECEIGNNELVGLDMCIREMASQKDVRHG